jgi:hypothetical protein
MSHSIRRVAARRLLPALSPIKSACSPFDKLRVKGGADGTLRQSLILSLSKDEGRSD